MRMPAVALLLLIAAKPLSAQTPCPQSADSANTLVIHARARIGELQFTTAPRTGIAVSGCTTKPIEITVRNNLPSPVQPGVLYRDVDVGIRIATSLRVLCSDVLRNAIRAAPSTSPLTRLCESRASPDTTAVRNR
jgi:hypothetical protein